MKEKKRYQKGWLFIIIFVVFVLVVVVFAKGFYRYEDYQNDNDNFKEIENNKENVIDKDNVVIDKEEKEVPIDIKESENDKEADGNSININENKEHDDTNSSTSTNPNVNTNRPVINSPSTSNSDINKGSQDTTTSETIESPEPKPELPPVVEDKNDVKRKSMENTYGIKILYGNEIGDYTPKGVHPSKLTDSSEIENYLNRLNVELAKYPTGFFQDFNRKGMPLTIYLIKSANGAFSGFTDYQFMNHIKLTLATDYNFEYTIHHELMHYIDCYLDIVMYPNNPYTEYEALNPSGFVYGQAVSSQIYNMASNTRGAYFISSYGATHVKEDRAEVFKFMTARAYKPIGCFDSNEIIRKKAEIISKQIKTYFPSVTGIAHWDRFIR